MPPWAHWVEPADRLSLVTTMTDPTPASRACSAAVSPAMPDPTTTTSAYVVHPAAGAASRAGTRGLVIRATYRLGGPAVPGLPPGGNGPTHAVVVRAAVAGPAGQ